MFGDHLLRLGGAISARGGIGRTAMRARIVLGDGVTGAGIVPVGVVGIRIRFMSEGRELSKKVELD